MYSSAHNLKVALAYAEEEYQKLGMDEIKQTPLYLNVFEYYLMGTYPPLKAMHPISAEKMFFNASSAYNLYFHIPFCKQLCTFCHFAKEINAKDARIENYLTALHKEIDMVAERINLNSKVKTVFFGGGTPSILNPSQIKKLFDHIKQTFNLENEVEITFELHPGLIHQPDYEERIQALKAAGVNRWVCGVQSMEDKILKKLNRGHTVQDVYQLIEILNQNNINNLSLDLMYGLPYQTIENWYESIVSLLKAGVTKYNVFPLMFKMSDPITWHYIKEPSIFPDGKERLLMHFIAEYLYKEHGFSAGPVFYYSKSSMHSKQQKSKFEEIEEVNLLPFGVSSFGYVGNTQYYNHLDIDRYISAINEDQLPIYLGYELDDNERMRRHIMFSLRSKGITISRYIEKFGKNPLEIFSEQFNLLRRLNFIEVESDVIRLTRYGTLFADSISLLFVSDAIRERVKASNLVERQTARDSLIDKYDFSPIERLDYESAKDHFPKSKIKSALE
jgi:oxygen-independent coproporphyrinogen-3 oxidase